MYNFVNKSSQNREKITKFSIIVLSKSAIWQGDSNLERREVMKIQNAKYRGPLRGILVFAYFDLNLGR